MNIEEMIAAQQKIVDAARADGRGLSADEQRDFDTLQGKIENARQQQQEKDTAADAQRAVETERQRVNEIFEICRQAGMDAAKYIKDGVAVDEMRQAALEHLIKNHAPVNTGAEKDEGDQFRSAAADALLISAGVTVDNPTQGADDMRGMSLRDIAIETLSRGGAGSVSTLLRHSREDIWSEVCRSFLTPTAAFPAILDNAIQKAIVQAYKRKNTTFDVWTSRGVLKDFKPSKQHDYLIGGGNFEKVNEGGEIQHSTLETALLPFRKLDTYATQFTMTREAFINDDIGFLSNMPAQYARAAKTKINKQVYEMVFTNPAIYDGVALFDNAHKNILADGSAPSIESLQKMMLLLLSQTDPFGNAITIQPKYIVVPVGYGFLLSQLLETAEIDVDGIGNHTYNALRDYRNQLAVVEDGTLNVLANGNAVPWFIVGDPGDAKSIQVDYLNGIETPSFRRSEKAGYLGFVWDIWLDWGITPVDFRGIVRNDGVTIA